MLSSSLFKRLSYLLLAFNLFCVSNAWAPPKKAPSEEGKEEKKGVPQKQAATTSLAATMSLEGGAGSAASRGDSSGQKSRFSIASLEDDEDNDDEIDTAIPLNQSRQMKFKLGFEFQEISGLCPWALKDNNIQKKPIFCLKVRDLKAAPKGNLWHVVIDTSDIEFVTKPFTSREPLQVEQAIDTINLAIGVLHALLTFQEETTFEEWIEQIEKNGAGKHEDDSYLIGHFNRYASVRDRTIKRPSLDWAPRFTPQATIQHPLEATIPLYFGLFGFSSRYIPFFAAALPFRDSFLKAQEEADAEAFGQYVKAYQMKMQGLVFLHALTLVNLAPLQEIDDAALLNETYKHLTTSSQVDPKMKLTLMSRRPFSSMFKDIGARGDYATFFKELMGGDRNSEFRKVPSLLSRVNFGEQFFDPETGEPKSLLHLRSCFRQEFFRQNKKVIEDLLGQGVVSTAMIRNFEGDVEVEGALFPISSLFGSYYGMVLKTVSSPKVTFTIDINDGSVKITPHKYDVLSPPYFLNTDNAMGRFKEEMTAKDKQTYGEAIVEVRAIRDVQSWFLKKSGLDKSVSGYFMTQYGPTLKKHALCLFDFLRNFGTVQDEMEILHLGMPFALRRY